INPAIAHGIAEYVGSIEVGKYADIVLWRPDMFGVKPETVFKCGLIMMQQMGDSNASIRTPKPVHPRDMFAAFGTALQRSCLTFRGEAAGVAGGPARYGLQRQTLPVRNCRRISKKDLKLNDTLAKIEIDPETFRVRLDGQLLPVDPAERLSLTQRYFLF